MRDLTVKEVAERLHVSPETITRLIRAGRLFATNIALGKRRAHYRIEEAELVRFRSEQAPQPKKARRRQEKLPAGFSSYV